MSETNNSGAAVAMIDSSPRLSTRHEQELAIAAGQVYAVLDVAEAIRDLATAVREIGVTR